MTIETPLLKPSVLRSIETDFGSTICKAIWRKVMMFQLWTNRSLPVGMILNHYGSQTYANGDPLAGPNTDYWQWCDGGVIANANSPLNGQNTPDFKEIFLKGASTIGTIGGQPTINLQHNHGGITSYEHQANGSGGDSGGDTTVGTFHAHGIANNMSTAESVIPPYKEIQYYIRVDGGAGQKAPGLSTVIGDAIEEDFGKFGTIMSNELATLLYNNTLWLDAMMPLGTVVPIMTNIPGVPPVDLNVWQECNGAEILNENSPLRSIGGNQYFTPDMTDRYIRVPTAFGESGLQGGVNTYDFAHNHTGYTEYMINPAGMDHSDAVRAHDRHRHTLPGDLSVINTEPPFYTVKFYMRIQ